MKCAECGQEIGICKTYKYNYGGRNELVFCNGPCLYSWIKKKEGIKPQIPEAKSIGEIKRLPKL